MIICLSPNFKNTDFPQTLSIDNKISIFEDRVNGWQLNIAKECAKLPHSGFAVLHIIISYIEAIAKYQDGFVQRGESRQYFKKGLLDLIPSIRNLTEQNQEQIVDRLYDGVRCGLYHGGMTSKGIFITGEIDMPLALINDNLHIHPNRLLDLVCVHFDEYIRQLKDSQKSELRQNFEKRFDM